MNTYESDEEFQQFLVLTQQKQQLKLPSAEIQYDQTHTKTTTTTSTGTGKSTTTTTTNTGTTAPPPQRNALLDYLREKAERKLYGRKGGAAGSSSIKKILQKDHTGSGSGSTSAGGGAGGASSSTPKLKIKADQLTLSNVYTLPLTLNQIKKLLKNKKLSVDVKNALREKEKSEKKLKVYYTHSVCCTMFLVYLISNPYFLNIYIHVCVCIKIINNVFCLEKRNEKNATCQRKRRSESEESSGGGERGDHC